MPSIWVAAQARELKCSCRLPGGALCSRGRAPTRLVWPALNIHEAYASFYIALPSADVVMSTIEKSNIPNRLGRAGGRTGRPHHSAELSIGAFHGSLFHPAYPNFKPIVAMANRNGASRRSPIGTEGRSPLGRKTMQVTSSRLAYSG